MVTPSYMLSILDEFRRAGPRPARKFAAGRHLRRRALDQRHAREIEQAFDMHAVDIYGLSEVMGPGVANECVETKDGLHIWEDHFYPEIIDPVTGEVLPDGEIGELVFTTLTKEALPMVRYRTRDLTRLLPGTARSMRRMEKITGRSDDMIILRGVNVFPDPDRGTGVPFRDGRGGAVDAPSALIEPHYPKAGPKGGPPADAAGDDAAGLFPAELVCLERSDGEESLYDSEAMRRFAGSSLATTGSRTRPRSSTSATCWSDMG
jgi:hypothetical protein